jgi:quercetin dioxygenase-like cupin family protein
MVDTGDLPFQQIGKGNIKIRTFDSNIDEFELKWHRDREDRKVTIIESNGWKYQEDNKLPINLKEGDVIFIPKETFHRVIKGNGDLKIKVEFK